VLLRREVEALRDAAERAAAHQAELLIREAKAASTEGLAALRAQVADLEGALRQRLQVEQTAVATPAVPVVVVGEESAPAPTTSTRHRPSAAEATLTATVGELRRALAASKAAAPDAACRAAALTAATAACRSAPLEAAVDYVALGGGQRVQSASSSDVTTPAVVLVIGPLPQPQPLPQTRGAGCFRTSYQWQRLPASATDWAGSSRCASLADAGLTELVGATWAAVLPAETQVSDTCPVRVRSPPAWELVLAVPQGAHAQAALGTLQLQHQQHQQRRRKDALSPTQPSSLLPPAYVTVPVHRTMSLGELAVAVADQLGVPPTAVAIGWAAGQPPPLLSVQPRGSQPPPTSLTVEQADLLAHRPLLRVLAAAPPPAPAPLQQQRHEQPTSSSPSVTAVLRSTLPPAQPAQLPQHQQPQSSVVSAAPSAFPLPPPPPAGRLHRRDRSFGGAQQLLQARRQSTSLPPPTPGFVARPASAPVVGSPATREHAAAVGAAARLSPLPEAGQPLTPPPSQLLVLPSVSPDTVRPAKVAALRRSISRNILDVLDVVVRSRSCSSVASRSSAVSGSGTRGGASTASRRASNTHAFGRDAVHAAAGTVVAAPPGASEPQHGSGSDATARVGGSGTGGSRSPSDSPRTLPSPASPAGSVARRSSAQLPAPPAVIPELRGEPLLVAAAPAASASPSRRRRGSAATQLSHGGGDGRLDRTITEISALSESVDGDDTSAGAFGGGAGGGGDDGVVFSRRSSRRELPSRRLTAAIEADDEVQFGDEEDDRQLGEPPTGHVAGGAADGGGGDSSPTAGYGGDGYCEHPDGEYDTALSPSPPAVPVGGQYGGGSAGRGNGGWDDYDDDDIVEDGGGGAPAYVQLQPAAAAAGAAAAALGATSLAAAATTDNARPKTARGQ
jgi:hypothetical protein